MTGTKFGCGMALCGAVHRGDVDGAPTAFLHHSIVQSSATSDNHNYEAIRTTAAVRQDS